ncbi:MAG TPA: hypothetical protein VGS57_09350 [Thermoanaerobaculia bacterium]|nr:hypothetical protein [Thermoanaerobaculia bacterium]
MTPELTARTRSTFCGDLTAHDHRNLMRYNYWLLAWVALWTVGSLTVKHGGATFHGPLGWAVAALTALPGVAALHAYIVFLREADELLRKVQLEALGLTFGVGALFMMSWRVVERAGGPSLDITTPLFLMFFVWGFAQWWVARRYR